MATKRLAGELTFTEQSRRVQLIDVTIGSVAELGYAKVSLARIAENAGITKAAVLYHFRSKDALVDAAYQHVLSALVADVAAAVESVDAAAGPAAYVRSMIGHLHAHPRHTRMLVEAMSRPGTELSPQQRWRPLADIVDAAASARGVRDVDSRTLAIITGGAIDNIVTEHLHDPEYDTLDAAERLVALVDMALRV